MLESFPSALDFTTFGIVLATMADTLALFALRRRQPERPRPYRAWGYPWVPVVYLAANAAIGAGLLLGRPREAGIALLVLALGVPVVLRLHADASARRACEPRRKRGEAARAASGASDGGRACPPGCSRLASAAGAPRQKHAASGAAVSAIRHDFHKLNRLPPYCLRGGDLADARRAPAPARTSSTSAWAIPICRRRPHVVEKICEAARNPRNHRYSASRGVPNLRAAITEWYQRRHGVALDPESEAIAVIGAKEGLSHFMLMTIGPGDVVLCPDPAYPIHQYAVIIAGGDLRKVPLTPDTDFIANLETAMQRTWPKPKLLILSFPANPTTQVVDRAFFERIVEFARENDLMVVHDFAYAEICFDGYQPPSILEVPGARDVAIEFGSLSKSHSMAGWRVGFAAGNPDMIHALDAHQELPRLRHADADPGRRDRRAARAAGLRDRGRRRVQGAPRRR